MSVKPKGGSSHERIGGGVCRLCFRRFPAARVARNHGLSYSRTADAAKTAGLGEDTLTAVARAARAGIGPKTPLMLLAAKMLEQAASGVIRSLG